MEVEVKSAAVKLRKKAEEIFESLILKSGLPISVDETLKLIHELRVHQIELEMQKEELQIQNGEIRNEKDISDAATERYQIELEMRKHELQIQNEKIRNEKDISDTATEKYTNLYDFAPSGYFSLDRVGEIASLNLNAARMLGKERSALLHSRFGFFLTEDSKPIFNRFLEKLFGDDIESTCELTLITADRSTVFLHITGIHTSDDNLCFLSVLDITMSKQVETYRELSREVLQILNEPGNIFELIKRVIALIKVTTGVEAVGIRLQEGEDFPYLAQKGFSDDFLFTENNLIEHDSDGKVYRNINDNVCLACNCGLVILGKINPVSPLFTLGGSWWTNNSTQLLDQPRNDTRFHPRNKCINQGFASMALVPVRNMDKIIGLIQLNDLRKDRFNKSTVEKLEVIASHIGAALVRYQNDELLRKKEEKHLSILQTAMDGFWIINSEGCILEVNDTYCKLSGYSQEELRSLCVSDLETEESDNDNTAHAKRIMLLGKDRYETRHRRKDGSVFDVEVSSQYRPEEGHFVSFIRDITTQKLAQKLLVESELKFRKYIDHSPHGIFVANEKGKYIDANLAASLITGYSKEELLSINMIQVIHEESMESARQHFNRVITKGFATGEFAFIKKDGSKGYWSVDAVKLSDKVFLGFVVDITTRKKTEEALANNERLLRESQAAANIGSYSADLINKTWTASPEMYQIFGIDENHPRTMEAWIMSVHPDFREELVNEVFQIEGQKTDLDREYKIVRISDHVERWVHGIGEFEYDNQMNPIRLIGTIQDITKRKQAEELLVESEEFLKKAQEIAHVGSWTLDLVENRLSWSDEIYRIFGMEPQELAATYEGFLDAVHPDDRDAVNSAYSNSIKDGKDSYEISHRIIHKHSGEIRHVFEKCEHLRDASGNIIRSVGMVMDNTEQKQADEALKQLNEALEERIKERTGELLTSNETLILTEEKYRTVADFTTNWEFWISPDDQMIYCSPSCERITGYSVADFVVNPQLLFEIIHPEDLPMYLEHKKQEMQTQACLHEIKFRIFRKDGSIRWIGHFCQPVFDELGIFKGIRGSNKDINSRKKSEELLKKSNLKYSLLSANITDGIFIFRDGCFEYANKAMNHIFGYQGTELIGLRLNHLILPEYANELNFVQSTPPLNQKRSVEIECVKKDQSIISVEFLFNYIATEKVIYGVAHDITDKKQIQKNIVKAIILTEEKERTYFSKELHDGLGPLLSTIKLYLEWSKEIKNRQSREEIVSKAEEIIEDSIRTVKEISNKLSPHILINFGLCSAIKSFVDKLQDTSSIKIEFDCVLNRRMGSEIEATIYRATIECVNNTIKHSDAKNIKISLHDTGNQLQLRYLDDGIGFDIKETIAMKKGLGLFNLQNRIQNIGGKIKMLSKPGKGVDYRIILNI